jgi:alkylation response protein AidB-like acyl-CoA dehydrogenase
MDTAPLRSDIDYVARARALVPLIEAAAPKMEAARELTPDVVEALHEAGLFRMLLPRTFGGGELDLPTFMEVIEIIAGADGSVAWCLGQSAGCVTSAAYLDTQVAQEIWSPPRSVMAWGPAAKGNRAILVDGGYRITATTQFLSGVHHATWVGCRINATKADGSPCVGPDGKPEGVREFLMPRTEVKLLDVWNVAGLRATGSDSFTVENLFIPAERTFLVDDPRDRRHPGLPYRFATTTAIFAISFAAVALGLARASLDAFADLAGRKQPQNWSTLLRANTLVQNQYAMMEAELRAARGYLFQSVRDAWDTVAAGAPEPTLAHRIDIRLAASHASQAARKVVDYAYSSAGATAIFTTNPFERRFRDMHAVSQQIQASPAQFTNAGQVLLGIDLDNPRGL